MSAYNPQDQETVDGGIRPLNPEDVEGWGLQDFRDAAEHYIRQGIESDENCLMQIPAGLGKSHSSREYIVDNIENEDFVYVTHTHKNRKEREKKLNERLDEEGKEGKILRSPDRSKCPIYGKQGPDEENVNHEWLRTLVNREMSMQEAHAYVDEQLPKHDDNNECAYIEESPDREEIDESDVYIVSHYHTLLDRNIEDKTVIFDEISGARGAHTHEFGNATEGESLTDTIVPFIQSDDETDIKSWNEFYELAKEDGIKNDKIASFLAYLQVRSDDEWRINDPREHMDKEKGYCPPMITPKMLKAVIYNTPKLVDPERDVYRFEGNDGILIVERNNDAEDEIVFIQDSFVTDVADSVTALDAMDKRGLWDRYYNISEIKSPFENVITEYQDVGFKDQRLLVCKGKDDARMRPYNNNKVTTMRDGGKFRLIKVKHDTTPGIISTANAFDEYDKKSNSDISIIPGNSSDVKESYDTMHHGAIRSNRKFEDKDVVIVSGSNHPPGEFIRRECYIEGKEPELNEGYNDKETFQGRAKEIRDIILEEDTMQAFMRARKSTPEDKGSIVYVDTGTIPENYRDGFDVWEYDHGLLNTRNRMKTFDAMFQLDIEDCELLNEKAGEKAYESPYNILGRFVHKPEVDIGFTKTKIREDKYLPKMSANDAIEHFQNKGVVEKVKESRGPNPAIWQYKGVEKFLHKKKSSDKQTKTRVDNPYKKAYLNANNDNNNNNNNNQKNQQEQHSNNNSEEKSQSKMEELKEQNQEFMEKQQEQIQQYKKELKEMRTDGGTKSSQDTDGEVITDDMPKAEKDRIRMGLTKEEMRRYMRW